MYRENVPSRNQSAFRSFVSCILLATLPLFLTAQTRIKAEAVNFRDAALDKSFSSYQVYEMDMKQVYELSKSASRFHFTLALDGQRSWNLQLDYHDLRGPKYREVALTDDGPKVLPRRPNITFWGVQGTESELVRFTITPDYVIGMIEDKGDTWFVEPLNRVVPGTRADYYFVYRAADVLTDPAIECTFTAAKEQGKHEEEHHHNKPSEGLEKMGCMEVEMATAGDFLMFQKYGSVAAVNDFIITVTNLMEPLYDDFNLDYLIVDQFVPTSAAANPWTTSDEAFDILDDFSAWAPVNFLTHDVGQIWTDRDIQGCGGSGNFGLIGCAQTIGGVCGAERYNVCEDFSNSSNCLRVLSAHELGHLWDGTHGESEAGTIMSPSIQCGATTWAAGNITRIQDHIDSRACLAACGTLCNISMILIVGHEGCPGASDGSITAVVSGNAAAVTYTLTGPLNLSNGTGVFSNLPPGNYTLRAIDGVFNETCFDEFTITLDAGVDNILPEPVCLNPTVELDATGVYNLKSSDVYNEAASSDNCGEVNLQSYLPFTLSCSDVGAPVTVTVTVNDGNGNTNTCEATVTVEDNTPPILVCPADLTVSCDSINELAATGEATATDNCDPAPVLTFTDEVVSGDCDWECTVERTWKAVDLHGNESVCVQTIISSSLSLLKKALSQDVDGDGIADPMVVGRSSATVTLDSADAACIISWMPSKGDSAMSLIVAQVQVDSDCLPGANPLESDGTLTNPLFAAGIELGLKVRMDTAFANRLISATGCDFAPIVFQFLPPNPRVKDLLRLANIALSHLIGPPHLEPLLDAMLCVNEGYDFCDMVKEAAKPDKKIQASVQRPKTQAPDFRVFPNPTSGEVTVDLTAYPDGAIRLELYDVQGRVLQALEIHTSETMIGRLDLAAYQDGIYLIRVQSAGMPAATKRIALHRN